MTPSQTALEQIAPDLIERIKNSQLARGLKASGRSADSLNFVVIGTGRKWRLEITGAYWWQFQIKGRGPNAKKGRPSTWFVNVIKNWIRVKNLSIPLTAAGAIAYKLVNKGSNVPNRFNDGKVVSEPLARGVIKDLLIPSLKANYLSYIREL